MKKILKILIIVVLVAVVAFCVKSNTSNHETVDETPSQGEITSIINTSHEAKENTTESGKQIYHLGFEFECREMDLVFGKAVQLVTVNDKTSPLNGQTVIRVPAFCKNIGTKPCKFSDLALLYYFQPENRDGQICSADFRSEDGLDRLGEIEPGSHIEGAVYLLYKGIGTYHIKLGPNTTVEFSVMPK